MNSTTIQVSAPAKINLLLHILGKRADNYHQLETIFQSIDLFDQLTFTISPSKCFEIRFTKVIGADGGDFPLDASNLIHRAVEKFMDRMEKCPNISIEIEVIKGIPIGAGLAGGSADAAAALLALNSYFADCFSQIELGEIAAELGADVPFSLTGGTSVGRGKGDELEQISYPGDIYIVLVKPRNIAISSSWAYSAFDEHSNDSVAELDKVGPGGDYRNDQLSRAIEHLTNKSIEQASQMFCNDFESIVFRKYPVLQEIKNFVLEKGCLSAHMSGSGSTIFGVLKSKEQGQNIFNSLTEKQKVWSTDNETAVDAWLVKFQNHGVKITGKNLNESKSKGTRQNSARFDGAPLLTGIENYREPTDAAKAHGDQ